MENLIAIFVGMIYFFVGIFLLIINFFIFKKFSNMNVGYEILEDQNKAIASVIKGQLIGQSIMISSLIYFLGTNISKIYLDGVFYFSIFLTNLLDILAFGFLGIVIFQLILYVVGIFIPLKKEIIIDNNESLGEIISALLISISLILSISLYAY